jgi:DNA-binding transcriptional regulator YhcF (GntR family)
MSQDGDMRIPLDPESTTPLSEQLRATIARRVARGSLPPSTRLPTVRDLAARLRIAPNTVAKAYRALEAEGLVVGRGRVGTFVADRLALPRSEQQAGLAVAAATFVRRTRQLGASDEDARRAVRRAQADI